jgi:hypothetical protein
VRRIVLNNWKVRQGIKASISSINTGLPRQGFSHAIESMRLRKHDTRSLFHEKSDLATCSIEYVYWEASLEIGAIRTSAYKSKKRYKGNPRQFASLESVRQ